MLKVVLAAGAAALCLIGGTANAAVVFYSFGNGAPALPIVTEFNLDTVGLAPTHALSGYSWSGNGVVTNTTTSLGAEPAIANGVYGTGNYLDIQTGHSETLNFAPGVKEVEVYVGSLDAFNDLSFMSGGSTFDFSGSQLGSVSGADNGAQTLANTNGIFLFTFVNSVSSLTMSSSGNALEISKIYASSAVPEPMTWAMMVAGMACVGGALRLRRKSGPRAAAA
jgi:hypothetical protein